MTVTKASASYKKQDGTLQFDDTKASLTWDPIARGKAQSVTIAISDITNLQQTPVTSPKCALKVVVQASTATAPDNHVFNFTNPNAARAEQESITDALRSAISAARAGSGPSASSAAAPPTPAGSDGQSGAMAFASTATVTAGAARTAAETWYDDQKLLSNHELQQSLLLKDPALRQRFEESLRSKPEGISNSQFAAQFWRARIPALRAHAVERSQAQGAYNVLAEVKPRIVDGATKLNLSKEQIQLIFAQHPIVKRVYNEVVPKLSEMEFWARFFVSRLFKRLKGERIGEDDSRDAVLDKYLDADEDGRLAQRNRQAGTLGDVSAEDARIPHFIDLEGNEQNHSQRKGNRPDFEMRPAEPDKVPILRVLNSMSEKMLAQVVPADEGMFAPAGMDEETFNQLRLRDLQADTGEDRVVLNIRDQRRLFAGSSSDSSNELSEESQAFLKQDPRKVLAQLNKELAAPIDLAVATLPKKPVERDPDAGANPPTDQDSTREATTQILSLISHQRALLSSSSNTTTLPPHILQSLLLTHSTSIEFLHYFYTLALGTNASSASSKRDIRELLSTLDNSLARIAAVAADAEKERRVKVDEARKAAEAFREKTGRKRRVDEKAVGGGGKEEVERLMGPTVRAIEFARERFGAAGTGTGAAMSTG